MIVYWFIFLSLLSTPVLGLDFSALEKAWGLSSLKKEMQHPLERIELIGNQKDILSVSSWYEDLSITKAAPPDQRLFCRFMHNFIYGRAKIRSKARDLPPSLAFNRYPQIKTIQFQYFSVMYQNKPSSPFWDHKPSEPGEAVDPKTQLRVVWTREESAIPYMSMDISRAQWAKIEKFLRTKKYYGASEFRSEICRQVFEMVPDVRSNFAAIAKYLDRDKPESKK